MGLFLTSIKMFSSLVTVRGLGYLDLKWALNLRRHRIQDKESKEGREAILLCASIDWLSKGRSGLVPWVGETLEP